VKQNKLTKRKTRGKKSGSRDKKDSNRNDDRPRDLAVMKSSIGKFGERNRLTK
jgi:hypothetical protein